MTSQDVVDIIVRCARTVLPDMADHVFSENDSLSALGANSLDRAEIVIMALDELSLRLPLTQLHGPKNIGELADLLYSKLPHG
jgi:polyketide biosynthesis acyl carrier protein